MAIVLAFIATSIATATTVAGPPYTPVSVTYSTKTDGGCEAILSVTPTYAYQALLDCSAAATPTNYLTTTTKTIEVACGSCTHLWVQGGIHGCPMISVPTTTVIASATKTDWVYSCSQ
jgi:hypothetical protein